MSGRRFLYLLGLLLLYFAASLLPVAGVAWYYADGLERLWLECAGDRKSVV